MIPVTVFNILLMSSLVGWVFLCGYLYGRYHSPAWRFSGDLEKRALEVAKSQVVNKVIEILTEEEDSNVVEMKR